MSAAASWELLQLDLTCWLCFTVRNMFYIYSLTMRTSPVVSYPVELAAHVDCQRDRIDEPVNRGWSGSRFLCECLGYVVL